MNSALKGRLEFFSKKQFGIGCSNHAWVYLASLYRPQSYSIRLSHKYVWISSVLSLSSGYKWPISSPMWQLLGLGDVGGSFQLCICSTWYVGNRPTEFVWWWLHLLVGLLLHRMSLFASVYSLSEPIENIGTLNLSVPCPLQEFLATPAVMWKCLVQASYDTSYSFTGCRVSCSSLFYLVGPSQLQCWLLSFGFFMQSSVPFT